MFKNKRDQNTEARGQRSEVRDQWAKSRQVRESGGSYHLREKQIPYNSDFTPKNSGLSAENTYFWMDNP